ISNQLHQIAAWRTCSKLAGDEAVGSDEELVMCNSALHAKCFDDVSVARLDRVAMRVQILCGNDIRPARIEVFRDVRKYRFAINHKRFDTEFITVDESFG